MQQMRKDSIANQLRMLTHSGTTNTQRYLLNEMTDLFQVSSRSFRIATASTKLCRWSSVSRAQVEAEALEHHASQAFRVPTPEEGTAFNVSLIGPHDPAKEQSLLNAIHSAELRIGPSATAQEAVTRPVTMFALRKSYSRRRRSLSTFSQNRSPMPSLSPITP